MNYRWLDGLCPKTEGMVSERSARSGAAQAVLPGGHGILLGFVGDTPFLRMGYMVSHSGIFYLSYSAFFPE